MVTLWYYTVSAYLAWKIAVISQMFPCKSCRESFTVSETIINYQNYYCAMFWGLCFLVGMQVCDTGLCYRKWAIWKWKYYVAFGQNTCGVLITSFCEFQQNEGSNQFSEKHINMRKEMSVFLISFVVKVNKNEGMLLLSTVIRRNAVRRSILQYVMWILKMK